MPHLGAVLGAVTIMPFDQFTKLIESVFEVIGAAGALLSALYTVALLIPGDEPDNTIKRFLDFTQKFSRK